MPSRAPAAVVMTRASVRPRVRRSGPPDRSAQDARPGKPSLALDLIEEFRQMVVDRTVLALLGRGVELRVDESGRLDDATRKLLADRVFERLDGEELYEGKRHKLRTIIQMQARHLATFVRRERAVYRAWVGRW